MSAAGDDEGTAAAAVVGARPSVSGSTDAPCPICGARTQLSFAHPDADIYRCDACTHTFSRLDTVRTFERYDQRYFEQTHKNWFEHPNHALFQWVDDRLPRDAASVVDVGCGNGDFLRFLRHRRADARLVGVDLSAPPDIEGVELVSGDLLTAPVRGPFDAVVTFAAIEHVTAPVPFAQRLVDLCKPGGTVVVMTLNANGVLYRAARTGRRLGVTVASDRLYSTHHLQHFTPASLRCLLERSGLDVVEVHHHNAPLEAMDLPGKSAVVHNVLLAGVAVSFGLGALTRSCYLQTMVCRRPTS
jgi:2-polyprenyl-3-methyl-5-hydroxy-6-metoxy-1,4-benzoquinol methylase